jgi:hypothetical protein
MEGSVLVEPVDIGRAWARSGLLGVEPTTRTAQESDGKPGDEFDVLVRWVGSGRDGVDVESQMRVRHGAIVEQWHGEVLRFVPVVGPSLEVSFAGDVSTGERDEVVAAMQEFFGTIPKLKGSVWFGGDPILAPEKIVSPEWTAGDTTTIGFEDINGITAVTLNETRDSLAASAPISFRGNSQGQDTGVCDGGSGCAPCAADYDQDGGVTGADLAAFFADFEAGAICADVDQDGGVTGGDIGAFFFVFEAGGCF